MNSFRPVKTLQFETVPKISGEEVKDLIKSSYERNKKAEDKVKKYGLKIDHKLSNSEHKVFYDEKKDPFVVFTGSRKVGDWVTNLKYAVGLGNTTKRFKDSKKLINDVKKTYGSKPITTLGHSLGGKLAEIAGGDKIITLDKASGLQDIFKTRKYNQTDIRTNTDLVSKLSSFQRGGKSITIKDNNKYNQLAAHSPNQLNKIKNKII